MVEWNFKLFGKTLNRREQTALSVAAVVIVLFLVLQVIVFPLFEKRSQMRKAIAGKKKTLREMMVMKADYEALKQKSQLSNLRVKKRDPDFTLFSFLDTLAGTAGVKGNISYMKPSTVNQPNSNLKKSLVEMKLQDITVEQMTTLLYGIETSENMVVIKRLSITKKGKEESFISVVMQVETMEA